MAAIFFHGNASESVALLTAFQHHCTCEYEEQSGKRMTCCAGHDLVVHDQRALDGLLFMRRQVAKLVREEFCE